LQVYQQALVSDPTYQEAISQRLADQEGVPITRAQLLPQAAINGGPALTKFHESPIGGIPGFSTTSHGYSVTLTLTQTVFNFAQFKALSGAHAVSRAADATLNAASQNLMLRVAQAYFSVLRDEDNLRYNRANKKSFNEQYGQIQQEYKSGLKTITDVYTARSSYDTAAAAYIGAETQLADDRENLRAITGSLYPELARLREQFPLVSPQPAAMEAWVNTAKDQNWAVKAAEYTSQAARENVKQQVANHLPTVSLQGAYNVAYNNNLTNNSAIDSLQPTPFAPNRAHTSDATVSLNLGMPLFSGGQVVAQTNQARYNYEAANQKLEATLRNIMNTTRQSYLGVMSGIEQVQADRQAIKSTFSSLDGLRSAYRVGTQTLVDVLNQQQKVFQAETQYATDRYAYVMSLLTLKQAAGTLSEEDLQAINAWLDEGSPEEEAPAAPHHFVHRAEKTPFSKIARKKMAGRVTLAKAKSYVAILNPHLPTADPDLSLAP
jgi:outer membrane protein